MLLRSATLVAALVAAVPSFAQTPQQLIGIVQNPLIAGTQNMRQNFSTCATVVCPLPIPPAPAATPWAGGTGYDASVSGVWMTNGTLIGMFDPRSCAVKCPVAPTAPLLAGNIATGLAVNEARGALFISDNLNNIWMLKSRCPLLPGVVCAAPVPAGQIIGGLATDDVNDVIFYSHSFWAGAPANGITMAAQATPCMPRCRFALPSCATAGMGPITGLAYDACKGVLWATDGVAEIAVTIAFTPIGCVPTVVACCRVPGPERYLGLCIHPSQATSVGGTCTSAPCAVCPALSHDTIGDPTLANPSFALTLNNAPAGAASVLAINLGPCGPGLLIPPFCGPLHVPLPGIITLSFPTGGTVGCTGGVNVGLPIPPNPAICGIPLASQFLVVCPPVGGVFGTAVSNCLSWVISST